MADPLAKEKARSRPGFVKQWLGHAAAFALGVAAVIVWQALPTLSARFGGEPTLGVVVPAVTEANFTFQRSRGFDALLASPDGKRLEFPRMWLPGEAQVGARYQVTTGISLADEESRFAVTIVQGVGR